MAQVARASLQDPCRVQKAVVARPIAASMKLVFVSLCAVPTSGLPNMRAAAAERCWASRQVSGEDKPEDEDKVPK